MNEDMKTMLAAIGRCLLAIAVGEEEATLSKTETVAPPAPEQDKSQEQEAAAPEKKRKRGYHLPERSVTCAMCGTNFLSRGNRAKYCQDCQHQIQLDKIRRLAERQKAARELAKAEPETPPLVDFLLNPPSPTHEGKVRCERMHATIPATMCGTRGECQGKPLCPNLPGGK